MKSKKFNEVRPYTYWIQNIATGIKLLFTYDGIEEATAHELELTGKAKDNKRYANIRSYPSVSWTPEIRRKASLAKKGIKQSEEHKRNL